MQPIAACGSGYKGSSAFFARARIRNPAGDSVVD